MGLDMYLYARKHVPADSELGSKALGILEGRDDIYDGEVYISGWDFNPDAAYPMLIEWTDTTPDPGSPHFNVTKKDDEVIIDSTIGYWRKANAIHAWFVEHVQSGVDECQYSPVSREQITQLRDTVQEMLGHSNLEPGKVTVGQTSDGPIEEDGGVVIDPSVAQQTLPTQSGFFFGSTDYDEWYVEDLKQTLKVCDAALALPSEWELIYRSSW